MLAEYSGQRLKQLRRSARLTQMQVVEMTGVSEATLCYLENGRRQAKGGTLNKLLKCYAKRIREIQKLEKILAE